MLIVLLGLLTGVIVFDIIHLLTGGEQWAEIAYWLIPAGVVAGLPAAVVGFADWTKIALGTRAKRIGALHGSGNVVVVLLQEIARRGGLGQGARAPAPVPVAGAS